MSSQMSVLKRIKRKTLYLKNKFELAIPSRKISDYIRAITWATAINKDLEKYKGINYGKDIYIVGGGPTASKYNPQPNDHSVYIGVNRSFKDKRFTFDYLFAQDQMQEGFNDFINYRGDECIKFLAIIPDNCHNRIREYSVQGKYERYVLASRKMQEVPYDISIEPFADLKGTVFSAIQFALYTNPNRIYLIGFDCSQGNIYKGNKSEQYGYQLEGWMIMKDALIKMGAFDKVVSINPVGLKGLFTDEYITNDD